MFTHSRNGFTSGDLSVDVIGTKVSLTVGKGTSTLNFDLYEAKAVDKRTEMQKILFRLADSATSLETDLSKAKHTIDTLRAQKGPATAAFMDLGPKKGGNPAKNKPKKTGMSVLNPTSKKRKAAHGVVFD